jgi:O-antigen/teichoic acid export membrane protein
MKLSRMFGMVIGLMGLRIGGAVLNLASQIIFTRIFIPGDVGVLFLAMSTAAFFGLLATGGYPWLAMTQLPRFVVLGLTKIRHAFHGAFIQDSIVAFTLICAICIGVSYVFKLPHGTQIALLFGCMAMPASMLLRYGSAVANSLRLFNLSYAPDFIVRPGLLLLYILAMSAMGFEITLIHALVAFVVVLYVVSIAQAMVLGRRGAVPSDVAMVRSRFTGALRPRALSLAVVALVATSFADLVTMIAGLLLPSDQLAVLAVTVRLAAIAGFVIQVAQQFILSDLTQAITRRDRHTTFQLLLRLNYLTIGTIAAGLLGAAFVGNFALSVFGSPYVAGQTLLITLMVGQSIRAFSGMNQQLLSIAGYQSRTAWACLLALAVFGVGAVIAAPLYGMLGIGFAVVVSELVWSITLAAQAQKLTGSRGDIFWLLKLSSKPVAL